MAFELSRDWHEGQWKAPPPTALQTSDPTSEPEAVFQWRFEQLRSLDIKPEEALELANAKYVDIHTAAMMRKQDCPPHTIYLVLI